MSGRAPVDKVGGTQSEGPWPEHVEEIVAGDTHRRPVELSDGSTQEVEVTVTRVEELPRGGYAVEMQYDDPTDGGGA